MLTHHSTSWRNLLALLAASLLLGLLAACGGGHHHDDNPTTGSLAVTVAGLPSGINGAVSVSGPAGYAKTLTQTQTLDQLAPGAYTITAVNVANGTSALAPTPTSQAATVTAGATTSVTVSYAALAPLALALQQVVSGTTPLTFLTAPPGDTRLFLVERAGRIRIFANGALLATPFLDISARTTTTGERGLLSLAFDPKFASNGYFFIYFTDLIGNITVERWSAGSATSNVAQAGSGIQIISIPHPGQSNHNGGLVSFGTDGYLYLATGDGGGAGDPPRNGQNLNVLLGKMLRLDVSAASVSMPYTIPAGNPFVGQTGQRGEIWAYGLRNPWRYAFDATDSLLYIADVGQGAREEIDIAAVGKAGNNYGWNIMEGTACYNAATCDRTGLVLPVTDYDHGSGCSITGGYVYRGTALPELTGSYLYSDYCGGWLKSIVYRNGAASAPTDWGIASVGNIVSFGQDGQNELYLINGSGSVYRIVRK